MTRRIRLLLIAITCLGAILPTVAVRAADSAVPGTPPKTIWDPRVVQVSATDETANIDADSIPNLPSSRNALARSDDALSATYPKSEASQIAKPAAPAHATTTANSAAPSQATTTFNRSAYAGNALAARAIPATPGIRQTSAMTQLPADPQSVTAPSATPSQSMPNPPMVPGPSAMPTQQGEPPLGSVDFDWGLHKPSEPCAAEGNCEDGSCPWYRKVSWFAGADYLLINTRLANQVAFREQSAVTTPALSTDTSTGIKYDFDDSSNFHVFAGFHTSCGDAIRFGYWHIQADDTESGTASGNFANGVGTGTEFTGPGLSVTTAGDTLTATSHVLLNMYDVDHLHRIDMPACDPCNCPALEIEWMYGFRIAQFHRSVDATAPAENGATGIQTATGDTQFYGAGPRVGFEASHTLGHTTFSAYITANGALLLGDFREGTSTTVPGIFQTAVSDTDDASLRIIPNFEMTAGLRWQPTCRTTFEVGYMFELFGNMASANSTSCTNCSGMTAAGVGSDVSFDGLTVRMEHCF